MHRILEQAVVVGDATARTLTFAARPGGGLALLPRLASGRAPSSSTATSSWTGTCNPPRRSGRRPERWGPQAECRHQFLHHAPVQDRPVGAVVPRLVRGRAAVGSSVDTIDGRHRDDVDDVGVSEVDFENGAVVAPLDRECVVGVRYFAMGYTVDDVLMSAQRWSSAMATA